MELIELFPIRKKQRQKLRRSYQFLQQEVEKFGKVYEQKNPMKKFYILKQKLLLLNLKKEK